jgi:pimeloyl-ACP methyl ester carboxylesterase
MVTVPADHIVWTWKSQAVRLGVDRLGAGPTVLLLPALSSISTRREMRPLQDRLASNFITVAVDWPGFGEEPRPAIRSQRDAYVAFLRYILTEVVPQPIATVAAGHAASYALAVGAAAPNSTGRLCLIAPTWRGPLPTMMGGKRKLGECWGSAPAGPVPLPNERQSSNRAYDGAWARLR